MKSSIEPLWTHLAQRAADFDTDFAEQRLYTEAYEVLPAVALSELVVTIRLFLLDSSYPSFSDRPGEGAVIALVLIGIFNGELTDRVIEDVAGTQIAGDHRGIARTRMCPGQRPATQPSISSQCIAIPTFEDGADFDVAELAHIIVAIVLAPGPTQKHIACRLHQVLADDDTLAVIRVTAFTCIRLKHRGACFFYLKEDRIVLTCDEERNRTEGTHAANANDLKCQVTELEAIKEYLYVFRQRIAVHPDGLGVPGL